MKKAWKKNNEKRRRKKNNYNMNGQDSKGRKRFWAKMSCHAASRCCMSHYLGWLTMHVLFSV